MTILEDILEAKATYQRILCEIVSEIAQNGCDKETFTLLFVELVAQSGKSQGDLATFLRKSQTTVSLWSSGKSCPHHQKDRVKILLKLCKLIQRRPDSS